jgi:hypothetical protein
MAYVKVTFPTRRRVYIDSQPNGYTNDVLRIDEGTHEFALGSPADYQPVSHTVMVPDTTVLQPLEIVFAVKVQT